MSDQHPPLKRHVALQPFSRDHYVGLLQAQRLMAAGRAGEAQAARARASFLEAWDREIEQHFVDEEQLLEGLISADDARRLRAEHDELRQLVREGHASMPDGHADAAWCARTGKALEAHIRWEERELFQRIQEQAGQDALARLEEETVTIEIRNRGTCHVS